MLGVVVLADVGCQLDVLRNVVELVYFGAGADFLFFLRHFELLHSIRVEGGLEARIRNRLHDRPDQHLTLASLGGCSGNSVDSELGAIEVFDGERRSKFPIFVGAAKFFVIVLAISISIKFLGCHIIGNVDHAWELPHLDLDGAQLGAFASVKMPPGPKGVAITCFKALIGLHSRFFERVGFW